MGFKTILVPTEQHDLMSSTLETALVFARKFDSYIEGFALRAGAPVAFNNESRARSLFEEFMRERGVYPDSIGKRKMAC